MECTDYISFLKHDIFLREIKVLLDVCNVGIFFWKCENTTTPAREPPLHIQFQEYTAYVDDHIWNEIPCVSDYCIRQLKEKKFVHRASRNALEFHYNNTVYFVLVAQHNKINLAGFLLIMAIKRLFN